MKITMELDEKYYRVIMVEGTHKLHSEKLNLQTAFKLACELKNKLEDVSI